MNDRSSTHEDISPRRLFVFRLVIVVTPIAFLLALEGLLALRFHAQYPNSSLSTQGSYRLIAAPYRGYGNNPTYVRVTNGIKYRYNNCGFRDEEDLGAKEPNEFRVFLMGGSTAYGDGVPEAFVWHNISGQGAYPSSETIAASLQEFLQEEMPHRKVKVINAAVVSYTFSQNYVMYLSFIRYLSPDLIVTIDGVNETDHAKNPMAYLRKTEDLGGGPMVRAFRSSSYTAYYLGSFVQRSAVKLRSPSFDEAEFADMNIEQVRGEFLEEVAASKPNDQLLDGIMLIYEQFWQAAKLDEVPILFAVQPIPVLDEKKKLSPKEELLLKYIRRYGSNQAFVAHLADRLTARGAQDPDFDALSLLSVFEDFPEMAYIDYAHLSPAANRHLAAHLADYILAQPDWINHAVRTDALVKGAIQNNVLASCGGADRGTIEP